MPVNTHGFSDQTLPKLCAPAAPLPPRWALGFLLLQGDRGPTQSPWVCKPSPQAPGFQEDDSCQSHLTWEGFELGCQFRGHQRATHGDTTHACVMGTPQLDASFPYNPPNLQSPTFLLQNTHPMPHNIKSQRQSDHVNPAPSSETCKISALTCEPALPSAPRLHCLSICLSVCP